MRETVKEIFLKKNTYSGNILQDNILQVSRVSKVARVYN